MRLCNAVICAAILFCISGCSGKTPTYAAGGKVKLADGSPFPNGSIIFRALDDPQHPSARGAIQPDGTFELSTFVPGDGAVAGKHQVLVATPIPGDRPGFKVPPKLMVDDRFSTFETSGLEFTVTKDPKQNRFEIEVQAGR